MGIKSKEKLNITKLYYFKENFGQMVIISQENIKLLIKKFLMVNSTKKVKKYTELCSTPKLANLKVISMKMEISNTVFLSMKTEINLKDYFLK